jgi:hypothetical protein
MIEAGSARTTARARLRQDAERSLDVEYDRATAKVRERRGIQNELRGVDSALRSADEARAVNQAASTARGAGSGQDVRAMPFDRETEQRLRSRREELQGQLDAPEMHRAEQLLRRAETNQAEHGRRWTDADHDRWFARRRAELAERPGTEARDVHERRRLLAAGIDPEAFAASPVEEQRELLRRADQTERTHRELLGALPADGDVEHPANIDLRALRRHVHDAEWRRARTQERRAIHREAWRRRAREHVYRARR